MNPTVIDASQWEALDRLLLDVAALSLLLSLLALAILIGHAIIPSLAASPSLPVGLGRLRAMAYLVAVAALAGTVFFGAEALSLVSVIGEIYPRFGI